MTKVNREDVSFCQSCYCSTHTIDGKCGKCGATKVNREWEEEFDKLTDTSSCPDGGCTEANEWLKNNKTLYSDEVYGEPMFDLDEDKIKAFIRQAVTQAEDNMRKRCVEALPKKLVVVDKYDRPFVEGFNQAIDKATQNINNLDKEDERHTK